MSLSGKLGENLQSLMGGGFFRPLSRPSAPIYVDCLAQLTGSSDEGGQLSHADTILLIRDVLGLYPRAELGEDEGSLLQDLRQRAGQFFNKLLEAGWLQERTISLDERFVLITPRARMLLRMLQELAATEVAELKDFAATLRSICRTLLTDGALDPNRMEPGIYRQTVKELLDRIGRAIDQMHAVETLILRHEEKQRQSSSAGETLNRLLVEFHAGEHMVCYDALQEGGLISQLRQARAVVQDVISNPFAKQRLADGLAEHRGLEPHDAYVEAEKLLQRLEGGLASIPVKQRLIDTRMADFSRLSAQRYRYQTELRGRRPELVKQYCEAAGVKHRGATFAELMHEPGLPLAVPDVHFFFGMDALARPRKYRPQANLSLGTPPPSGDAAEAQELIRGSHLLVVSPQRAGKFIERILPRKGEMVASDQLKLHTEDDLLDLLAVLAFEKSQGTQNTRAMRWKVTSARLAHGVEPEQITQDLQAGRQVEHFTLERIS